MTKRVLFLLGLLLASCQPPSPVAKSAPVTNVAPAVTPIASASVDSTTPPPPAVAPPPAEPTPPARLPLHPPSEFVLEDAGVEPREVFRFGTHEERVKVDYAIRVEPKEPGKLSPSPRGGSGNTVVIDVRSDDDAGAFLLAWRLVQVNGLTTEYPYNEQGMWTYFDARGRALSMSEPIADDDNSVDDLPRQLRFINNCVLHASVPFPEQPIGRGARWSQPLAREEGDPMDSEGHTTYRLVAVSAQQLVIEVTEDKTRKRRTPRQLEEMADGEVDMQTGSWKHTKKLILERARRLAFGTARAVVQQTFLRRTGDALTPEQTRSTWDCKVSFGGKVPSRDDDE